MICVKTIASRRAAGSTERNMLKLAQAVVAATALSFSAPAWAVYQIETSGVFSNNPGILLYGPITFNVKFSINSALDYQRKYGNTTYWFGDVSSFVINGQEAIIPRASHLLSSY